MPLTTLFDRPFACFSLDGNDVDCDQLFTGREAATDGYVATYNSACQHGTRTLGFPQLDVATFDDFKFLMTSEWLKRH